jgi:hypothetical protein
VRNYLKAAHFGGPDWIPCTVGIMPATWRRYREELEEVLLAHPRLFPDFERGRVDFDAPGDRRYRSGRFTDNWGCVWDNVAEGLDGMVVGQPLADWSELESWQPPDPVAEGEGWGPPTDWEGLARAHGEARAAGRLAVSGLPHGSVFMRLYYLRGFENLMLDFATGEPRLERLIEAVLDYNLRLVRRHAECGAELIHFGDDLGMQDALPVSPATWRRYVGPCYGRMFGICAEQGVDVYFHTDGHVLEIIPDLIEAGATILNPQIGANGLDGLERVARGRVCLNLDLNRQLFPFLSPGAVAEHIREAAERLDTPQGGLMLYAECEPDVPLANIHAICETLQQVGGPSC